MRLHRNLTFVASPFYQEDSLLRDTVISLNGGSYSEPTQSVIVKSPSEWSSLERISIRIPPNLAEHVEKDGVLPEDARVYGTLLSGVLKRQVSSSQSSLLDYPQIIDFEADQFAQLLGGDRLSICAYLVVSSADTSRLGGPATIARREIKVECDRQELSFPQVKVPDAFFESRFLPKGTLYLVEMTSDDWSDEQGLLGADILDVQISDFLKVYLRESKWDDVMAADHATHELMVRQIGIDALTIIVQTGLKAETEKESFSSGTIGAVLRNVAKRMSIGIADLKERSKDPMWLRSALQHVAELGHAV